MQSFFSVVIPLYNKEPYIAATIESVLNQTYKDFEIIIVNDGSTDRSIDIVNGFSDYRITIITQKNQGLSSARNTGIKHSNCNYIAFLDADDLWCEDYLSTIKNLVKQNSTSKIFATAIKTFRENDEIDLAIKTYREKHVQIISNYFSLKKNLFCPSALVIKKCVFNDVGMFDDLINYGEDEDFFIRCFNVNNLVFYNFKKVYYQKDVTNQLTAPNPNNKRNIPDYSKYLTKVNKHKLKPYIDFIYFKLVVLYKMERNKELVTFYKEKIDVSNLSFIKKIKFYLPIPVFYFLKSVIPFSIR